MRNVSSIVLAVALFSSRRNSNRCDAEFSSFSSNSVAATSSNDYISNDGKSFSDRISQSNLSSNQNLGSRKVDGNFGEARDDEGRTSNSYQEKSGRRRTALSTSASSIMPQQSAQSIVSQIFDGDYDDIDDNFGYNDENQKTRKERYIENDPKERTFTSKRTNGIGSARSKSANFNTVDYSGEEFTSREKSEGLKKSITGWDDREVTKENNETKEKDALYEAYNLLHNLAQDFQKPFDAPAVVVVGHQSSGKSALIEALMGFQFNQVGGGTKTRRPIALRMQYNPSCSQPRCFLQGDDGVDRPVTLSQVQEYIDSENLRLERDPMRSFDSREINIRMEYKYCPNMILIDTPGLIAAPRIPKGLDGAVSVTAQQRALMKSAREAERLVVEKMKCEDYIILCVEDTMDWKHGATREIVQKADPDLSRTIIVNTKLDTKIPQFGTPSDVGDFLAADIIDRISPHKLGGPFFTSVPSGRVGRPEDLGTHSYDDEYLFEHDDDFVSACIENEERDRSVVMQRLKKFHNLGHTSVSSSAAKDALVPDTIIPRIGLSFLRGFLEKRVDECYKRNVAKILPLLKAEYLTSKKRLEACEKELEAISLERLKKGAEDFCDDFCKALKESIEGSIVAPPTTFGENLEQESSQVGSFHEIQGCPLSVSERTWERLLHTEVGNIDHRLYGGSQYHRAMREFNLATRCLRVPIITEDEIANAAGIGDTHDGVNFLRASCIIALEKARISFDPLLDSLRMRLTHVMNKICPVSEYILTKRKERVTNPSLLDRDGNSNHATDVTHNPQFRQAVRNIYGNFVQLCADSTMRRCQDDLTSLTRFVTWDIHERSSGALSRSLPDQTDIVAVYKVAVATKKDDTKETQKQKKRLTTTQQTSNSDNKGNSKTPESSSTQTLTPINDDYNGRKEGEQRDYNNLLQLMEEAACSRDADRTNMVVGGLVQYIITQWRETFSRSVTTKYNCYFLLPFVDEFHRYLRRELQKLYDGDGDNFCDIFDLSAARKVLQNQRETLFSECSANKRLQEKFEMVSKMMRKEQDTVLVSN